MDEKAFRKGHKYMTVGNDLVRGRVLYVAEDRKQESLDGFWCTLTEGQRTGIEAVAMDMWDPYVNSVREHVAEADRKIVFDKFHVAQHLSQAVDEVRRKENKVLQAEVITGSSARVTTGCATRRPWTPKTAAPLPPYARAN